MDITSIIHGIRFDELPWPSSEFEVFTGATGTQFFCSRSKNRSTTRVEMYIFGDHYSDVAERAKHITSSRLPLSYGSDRFVLLRPEITIRSGRGGYTGGSYTHFATISGEALYVRS